MDSSFKNNRMYDVLLSSGGEDTRRTFTDHLYCTLIDHRFNVFMYGDEDDYKLEKSNGAIPEHLIQAIETSKVAVVVFSRGYPESMWCLEELVKIMECRKTKGQLFFPILYGVDPSDVRNQTGSFAQAFQKYEQEVKEEKIRLWRNALKEAGSLAALNFRKTDGFGTKSAGYEGNFIRNLIAQITGKLGSTTCLEVPTTTSLVGLDSRVQKISKHLDVGGSNDVRIIGILGMCGLGKTMVAKAIFNKHHRSFDGASFLENVRGKKLVDLQKQLLSNILKSAYIVVSSINEGTKEIEQRLGNRRVLVVVDDLDSVEQLNALAIKPDSFGPGSRVIITSRNEHVLKILNVDKICPLPAMNEREALELLSWHAFGKNYPNEEYFELSRKAVGYSGGLPLALEVLGSYLRKKSTSEWETVLEKWRISQPYREIHRTLKISYDGLTDDDVKAIFLDISCFFTGMNKDYVMTVLDGCQFYPEIGIQELQDHCLITVDKEGNLMMHDLIQGMGREIVCAESPDNPGKRSRLWHNEDITDVLTKQSGTEDVEGLSLDMQASDERSISSESFRNMQSLRLLKLNNIKLTGSYNNFSKELRWLCWHGFPLEVIPKDFDQPNLVAIDLSYSKLIRVWEDSNLLLEKLKLLDLSHSHNLAQTPDFTKLPNLEQLILKDCESLSEVHTSIGNLERLTLVNLEGCKNLKDLPLNFFNSKSFETLLLKGCSGKSYDRTANGTPIRPILKLSFSSQHGVKESPSASLLPPSLRGLNSLRKLDLGCCTLTDDEIPKDLGSLISLEDLDLRKNSFCSLPSLSGLSKLEALCLDACTNLHTIPNLPTNLKVLRASLCTALETMPNFSELSHMRELYLSHSRKLREILGLDMSLSSMTRIHMEGCINLTADFRKNILQGWTSCGYGGIFLNGNYIPDWFDFVMGDLVSFHIPLIVGRNFSGLTLCCNYSSNKQREGPLGIIVSNKTKRTALLARITYASVPTSCTLDDHYIWQGHLSNYVLSLQGGDKVDIFVKPVETADASVRVKKIGVNLVWDKFLKENMHDSDLHLYNFDQHPDLLLGADRVFPSSCRPESKWPYMTHRRLEDIADGKRPLGFDGGEDDEEHRERKCKLLGYCDMVETEMNQSSCEQSEDQQHSGVPSDSDNLIRGIGRDKSMSCLIRCSRSDYGSIASLNQSFRSLVRSGELYKLRRQNDIVEHWIYLCCHLIEWEAFDPNRGRWMHLPMMTSNECFMCSDKESCAVGTELLVFGRELTSHVIFRYSILTNSWSSGMRMNAPRCLFGSASLKEIAILAGGCDSQGNTLGSAELYNSETQTWEMLPSMMKPRKMCSGVFMDGKFYVIGGIGGSDSKVLTCGEEYDLKARRWTEIPSMSPGRSGAAKENDVPAGQAPSLVAVLNNELYAADCADMEVRKYDKERRVWLTVGRLPERAASMNGWGLAFRACGDRLIVIAGLRALGEGLEINAWVPGEGPPQWNLLAKKQSGNFVYNCAVMGC